MAGVFARAVGGEEAAGKQPAGRWPVAAAKGAGFGSWAASSRTTPSETPKAGISLSKAPPAPAKAVARSQRTLRSSEESIVRLLLRLVVLGARVLIRD
jgi:hypothetical protein